MQIKKINKKIKIGYAIGICGILMAIIGGSMWFGYQKPQTVWQDILSRAGYGKPEADAVSKIVFLGDSLTFLEDWNVLFGVSDIANAGISGNTTEDVLNRLDTVISSKPQKLFLMVGINDLLKDKDVSAVIVNYEKIVQAIKAQSPHTTLYIQSVLPVHNDISKYGPVDSQKIIDLNSNLKVLADTNGVIFINLYPYFCGYDNALYVGYSTDGLHLNSHGYATWKKLIAGYIY